MKNKTKQNTKQDKVLLPVFICKIIVLFFVFSFQTKFMCFGYLVDERDVYTKDFVENSHSVIETFHWETKVYLNDHLY
jgi:hypothetical protein